MLGSDGGRDGQGVDSACVHLLTEQKNDESKSSLYLPCPLQYIRRQKEAGAINRDNKQGKIQQVSMEFFSVFVSPKKHKYCVYFILVSDHGHCICSNYDNNNNKNTTANYYY